MANSLGAATNRSRLREALHPRKVRIVFDRPAPVRATRTVTRLSGGLPLAILLSLLLWGLIAAAIIR